MLLATAAWANGAFAATPAPNQTASPQTDLVAGFQSPPNSARPRVWWHWLNGNITKDGIRKDMEWMSRVGVGGLQNFDAALSTPQIVDKRLVYMTPEWKDAFRYAAGLSEQLGLEFAIASSPGWSETGGPWVQPKDGLKKLVWSETVLDGGRRFNGMLPAPPSTTGPYQNLHGAEWRSNHDQHDDKGGPRFYADALVLAFPASDAPVLATPRFTTSSGTSLDGSKLLDGDLETFDEVDRGTAENPGAVVIDYEAPQTIRSASVFFPGAASMFAPAAIEPRLEVSDDGRIWRKVADVTLSTAPTTVSFAPVTASHFRLVLAPNTNTVRSNEDAAPGAIHPGAEQERNVRIADLRLSGDSKVNQFEVKAGFGLVDNYFAIKGEDAPGADAVPPQKVIDLTSRMSSDGRLDWTPPPGRWRVVRFGYSLLGTTNHPATAEATGLEVDKYDGRAVRDYLETYLKMYADTTGPDLIGAHGLRALVTDSIEVGAANWTPEMIADFERLRGYDPRPWMPALTGVVVGSRRQSDAFLYDFRRTLADLISSQHYAQVATIAHQHGLIVYGEALENGRPSVGDDMTMRSHTDVPMSALWTYRKDGPNPTYIADMKGAASVAHIYGQNLVAAESMTAAYSPWAFAPADLRPVIDLEFATGVNRPVIHTSVHQPVDDKVPGLSLMIYGQYFNRHETWAEMARPWVDYMARNAFLLQQGRNVADVGYFYGEEAPLTGLYGNAQVSDAPTSFAYDFVSADVLDRVLSVDHGELVAPGGARYQVLYLGGTSQRMTLPTLRRLAALVEAGATVVGMAPDGSPSLADDPAEVRSAIRRLWSGGAVTHLGAGRVIASRDIEAALASIGDEPDVSFLGAAPSSRVLFVHRKLAKDEIYFVDNRLNRPEKLQASFRVAGKAPEIWRADTGRIEPVSYRVENGRTIVPLDFAAQESFFVVFRKPAGSPVADVKPTVWRTAAAVSAEWTVSFQPGRGAPTEVRMPSLQPLNENADPGVKYFSGTAIYRSHFTLPNGVKPGAPLRLDLGKVGDVAEVRVNGQIVGIAWKPPYQLDIGAAVRRGSNEIEIRVADLWVNRLIGDAQPGVKTKITFTTLPTYAPDAPLRPSGLIGPVTLLRPEQVEVH